MSRRMASLQHAVDRVPLVIGLLIGVAFVPAAAAQNPVPVITSISPSNAPAGSSTLTLTVTGSGFNAASVVRWNGVNRSTFFPSSTQLSASIPSSDLAAAGTAQVTVYNPPTGGGTSNAVTFTINANPVPAITSISPSNAPAGSSTLTLTVTGSGFNAASVVRWNGVNRSTFFPSSTQLSASIPSSDLAAAGTAQVTVYNPPTGGGTSNAVTFTINTNPVPVITSISPSNAPAGSSTLTLTVTGSGFNAASVVRWNGVNRSTFFPSSTQLSASIPSSDLAAAGTAQVTVYNPPTGGGTSNAVTFTINANPVPAITSISPSNAPAGSSTLTLTVTGSGFNAASVVRWNGVNRSTFFPSSTQLSASISASDLAAAGTAQVTVYNPPAGGGTSNAVTFNITTNPVPQITSLSPNYAPSGSSSLTMTVTGSGFNAASVVRWNGADRSTFFPSSTRLSASIPSSDFSAAGTAQVTVYNPPTGGGTSNAVTFYISTNPPPFLTSLSPNNAEQGSASFTLTLNGSNFVSDSVVRWNGSNRATTFVSSSQLKASIAAGDIATAGTAQVTVFSPSPGGGTSNALTFSINGINPSPSISSLSPANGTAGSAGFTLTIQGSGFVSASVARWNGNDRTTTFVNSSQLQAAIPAGDVTSTGTVQITVFNPTPGGGTSNAVAFAIAAPNPPPTITSVSPSVGPPSGGTAVTITGTNIVSGALIDFGGASVTSTVISSTQVAAITPPHAAGAVNVKVTNPDGQSATLANGFTYTSTAAPAITSITPTSGSLAGGTAVTINGTNFVSGATVTFGGASAGATFFDATKIIAITPPHTAGSVDVVVTNPDGQRATLAGGFAYVSAIPTITSISPTSGPPTGGTAVTINGTNFASGAGVTFGGVSAGATFFDAAKIIAVTPAHAEGSVDVIVTNSDGGRATLTNGFAYAASSACTPPSITSQPQSTTITSGQSATLSVTASGSTPLTYQWYIGAAGNTSSPISGGTNSSLTVSPTSTTTYWVRVTGQCAPAADSAAVTVTVNPPVSSAPTITSISPTSGPATGGTSVTINGSNFASGATASFGGTASASVTFISSSQLRATSPPRSAGSVSVTVTNPDSQSATLASAFTYTEGAVAVLTFTADRTSLNFGEATKLRWTTTNASFVSISGVGSLSANGSVDVTPRDTTRYTLTAYSSPTPATATTATSNLTVTVTVTRSIISFATNPRQIRFGEQATLSWATVRANSVSIDQGEGQQLPLTGSKLIKPLATTTYTLTALGGPNGSETATATISVIATTPPSINFFTATPPEILEGQSSTLSWASTGGSDADIDNGVNRVATTGTHVVRPKKTATYSLWVNGASGASTRTVTVRVGPRRPPDIGTLAGSGGFAGSEDGAGRSARFRTPWSIAVDSKGNTIVADSGNNTIRRIAPDGKVETIAGNAGEAGSRDGRGREALFNFEFYGGGVATDTAGNIYVSDTSNNTIRKVTPDGTVTTIAGSAADTPGYADGPASEARFNSPTHLAVARNGLIYVADTSNHAIRRIAPDGVVSTVAGVAGIRGYTDGPGGIAKFNLPHGLALDAAENLYVGDVGNDAVRKITPDGEVTTLAGGPNVAGKVMTNANTSTTRFNFGCCGGGLAVDAEGLLYVADRGSQTIRTVTNEGEVSTIAGSGTKGTSDGPAPDARFNNPIAVATDSSGRLYIADTDNHSIRATQTPATRRRVVKP